MTREYPNAFDEKVDAPVEQEGQKPTIRIEGGAISRIADEAEQALLQSELPIFVRAGTLVRPVEESMPAARGRTTIVAKLRPMCRDSMIDWLNRSAMFERYDARTKKMVAKDPPGNVASLLLAREGNWKFPRVVGLGTAPTLRPDGSLLLKPGYDAATRLYMVRDGLRMPTIAENPSRDDALQALELLRELLLGFPFVGPLDRAVAFSGLMTALLRNSVPTAPMHAVSAHTPGSGKSFLVDLFAALATGRLCPVIAYGDSEEESEKRLGALLREGVAIVSIDNVSGELGGDALCQITERPLVRIRILGLSEVPEFETRSAVYVTGNNLVLRGDMTRRALLCHLDPRCERPELREFLFNPITRVLDDRGRYIAAVLTIPRAYRAAGMPHVCGSLGSYAEWSELVRAPLIWLGEKDVVDSMEVARSQDPELVEFRELIGHWEEHLGVPSRHTAQQLITSASQTKIIDRNGGDAGVGSRPIEVFVRPQFRDFLIRIAGAGPTISSKTLGKKLAKFNGRIDSGYRLDMRISNKHPAQYCLSRVESEGA